MFANKKQILLLGMAAVLVSACMGELPAPEKVGVAMQPKTMPVRNLTSFNDALRCMDRLFVTHNKKGYTLTSTNLSDATGKLSMGVRDMLMTSISKMSVNSGAIHYIDLDNSAGQDSVAVLTEQLMANNRLNIQVPDAYIRGSISQVDDSTMVGKQGVALTTGIIDIGGGRDRSVSAITMDFNLMNMASRTSMPGMHSSNTLAVVRAGQGVDAGASGGKIVKAGIQFNMSQDSVESSGQAVRTLVELGLIELVGKWTKVPYWTCLEIEDNNPAIRSQMRDWYDLMPNVDRIKFIEAGLKGSGHYAGEVDGKESPALRTAIAKFQTDNGIVPNGNIAFEVYELLMKGKVSMAALPAEPPKETFVITESQPINITLTTGNAEQTSEVIATSKDFKPGDSMVVRFSLSRNGYPYCYYRDSDGVIAQIYPNRFQMDKVLQGNQSVTIPPPRGSMEEKTKFSLTFSKPGEEEVMCMASDVDIGSLLPKEWHVKELTPMKVKSLNEISDTMVKRSTQLTSNKPGVQSVKVRVR